MSAARRISAARSYASWKLDATSIAVFSNHGAFDSIVAHDLAGAQAAGVPDPLYLAIFHLYIDIVAQAAAKRAYGIFYHSQLQT